MTHKKKKMISFKEYILESASKEKKGNGFGCLMLMYNSKFKQKFATITSKIDPKDLYDPKLGFGVEDDPHVTIKYGLHEQDHDKVFATLGNLDPIDIKLATKTSLFESDRFDVVKIKIISQELRDLNRRICKIFDYTDKFDTYNPHTTVAYVKSGLGKKYLDLDLDSISGSSMTLNKICFSDAESNKKNIYLR